MLLDMIALESYAIGRLDRASIKILSFHSVNLPTPLDDMTLGSDSAGRMQLSSSRMQLSSSRAPNSNQDPLSVP